MHQHDNMNKLVSLNKHSLSNSTHALILYIVSVHGRWGRIVQLSATTDYSFVKISRHKKLLINTQAFVASPIWYDYIRLRVFLTIYLFDQVFFDHNFKMTIKLVLVKENCKKKSKAIVTLPVCILWQFSQKYWLLGGKKYFKT